MALTIDMVCTLSSDWGGAQHFTCRRSPISDSSQGLLHEYSTTIIPYLQRNHQSASEACTDGPSTIASVKPTCGYLYPEYSPINILSARILIVFSSTEPWLSTCHAMPYLKCQSQYRMKVRTEIFWNNSASIPCESDVISIATLHSLHFDITCAAGAYSLPKRSRWAGRQSSASTRSNL